MFQDIESDEKVQRKEVFSRLEKKLYATMVIFILSQNSPGILNFIILPCCSLHVTCSSRVPVGLIGSQVGILLRQVVDPSGSGILVERMSPLEMAFGFDNPVSRPLCSC